MLMIVPGHSVTGYIDGSDGGMTRFECDCGVVLLSYPTPPFPLANTPPDHERTQRIHRELDEATLRHLASLITAPRC